jgi:hypothetical protein
MNRRGLLTILGAGLLTPPSPAWPRLVCGPSAPPGVRQCHAGIDSSIAHVVAAAVGGQHLSQWCWAACIEMVFRYYGLQVPQEQIVQQTWGGIADLPAYPGHILANLNRPWIDLSGRRFRVSGDAFSANPMTAAQDLAQDMPLIIGTLGHAMVLTALTYVVDRSGNGRVTAAIVRDPWPDRGRRILSAQEWHQASFLARIRVFPL